MNLYQKLHKIQESISGLAKDKSANSYQYVTGDKVLRQIKPLMNEYGLLLKQEVVSITNIRQDYIVGANTNKQRTKSEIHSTVMMKFTWIDVESGEKDENSFGANGQNDWDKGVGSALTYAERYFLLKFFHIPTDEDDIDNPNRKNLKWATTDDLMQYAFNGYKIEDVKDQVKVNEQQEQEYIKYLERFAKYPSIRQQIENAQTQEELVKINDSLKQESQEIANDFKQMLNNRHKQLNK